MPFDLDLPSANSPLPVPSFVPPPDLSSPSSSLSPLSSPSPSPPHVPLNLLPASATLGQSSGARPKTPRRRRDAQAPAVLPPQSTTPTIRRILPLGRIETNNLAQMDAVGGHARDREKAKGGSKGGGTLLHLPPQPAAQPKDACDIEFPPPGIELHPDDANSKVFIAMGKAFMSVGNRAMTIKDLTELAMTHGIVCPSVSAASQAITFFIRAHLARCEEQGDFPVILRHHLSGTEKDDDLFPALYSRSGGNVSNKLACDENGVVKERLTCFRRNTIVWYLSKVAGAPCPFARAGIAIRDYAEGSAISAIEGRKGEDNNRGVKRKRDRDQRTSARLAKDESPDEEDESVEGKKPPKIKLTLRLRPCLTTMRDKQEEITSSSDSESESNVGPTKSPSVAPSSSGASPSDDQESAWSFPPFPIQRHISVPPFTPATESFPYIEQQSPIAELFTDWPRLKPKLELACTDTETSFPTYLRDRSSSVASPPPDSDDGFSVGEDDDESFTMSPEICFKDEDNYGWPQAALFTTSVDLSRVKVEPAEDVLPSKRSSLNTVTNVKSEDMELNFESLSLEVDDEFGIPSEFDADVAVKKEEGLPHISKNDTTWSQPIDLTMDEDPVARSLWRNVEILGPESVCRQELESNAWDLPDMRSYSASSQSPRSLVESAQSWSVSSPETDVESVGPLSPASFNEPEDEPIIQVNDSSPSIPSSLSIQRSEPWSVPGKELDSSIPSRIGASGTRSSTLAINESIVPWERGRYTIDDINDHLLQPVVPLILNDVADEESSHDLVPLSPQEEEIFQSLCFDPDVALTKPANSKAASSPFANIFAVATRPTERLRERRSSRLLSELERARPQSAQMQHQCDAQAQHVEGCNDNDRSAEEPMPMRITRSKDKAAAASNGAGKEPVRRSKRVASSVPQRKSQRLQGKNAH